MKRCAFLTMEDREGFFIDDELAHRPFAVLGWQVHELPWRQTAEVWQGFDAVLIRSAWDYQRDSSAFLGVLEDIERSGTPLFNGLGLVRWNLRKTYLRELELKGVPIVPTAWRDGLGPGILDGLFEAVESDEIVLKPVVGANADGFFRVSPAPPRNRREEVESYFRCRPLMAQPIARAILTEGEYSLFYFNGRFSHCIRKTPGPGDLRVQEEHGGQPVAVDPEQALLASGSAAIRAVPDIPLYARVDLVRSNDEEGFWLMELELIEPALYLRMDEEAPGRFARAFHDRMAGKWTNPEPVS